MSDSKWKNWPTQGGQKVAQGIEKSKDKGFIGNAYAAIQAAAALGQSQPKPKK